MAKNSEETSTVKPPKRKIGVFHARSTDGNERTIAVDISSITSLSVTRETNETLMFTLDQSGHRGRIVLKDTFGKALETWARFVDVVIFKRDAGDGQNTLPLALDVSKIVSIDTSNINGDTLVKTTAGNIPVMDEFEDAVKIWQG